jgi:hypothetical protein
MFIAIGQKPQFGQAARKGSSSLISLLRKRESVFSAERLAIPFELQQPNSQLGQPPFAIHPSRRRAPWSNTSLPKARVCLSCCGRGFTNQGGSDSTCWLRKEASMDEMGKPYSIDLRERVVADGRTG